MFFDRFSKLCDSRGISCKKAAEEIGLSNSATTKWKKTGATPRGETLQKIAAYFEVSIDRLSDTIRLSEDQQSELLALFSSNKSCSESFPFIIVRANAEHNFFPRLENKSLRIAHTDDLEKVACYLGVEEEYYKIIEKKPTDNNDDELEEYLEMLRTRPECRMLMSTVKGATKEQVEANVKFLESLRKND